MQKAVVNLYGRITTMSRRVVQVFEDPVTIDSPPSMLQEFTKRQSIYQKSIPLAPGMYRLNVVAKDVIGGNMNNYEVALVVPRMDSEKLASSSLILADIIEKVPTKSIGTGNFVIPKTNRLVVIHGGIPHKVCRVSTSAGSKIRASIGGFFKRK